MNPAEVARTILDLGKMLEQHGPKLIALIAEANRVRRHSAVFQAALAEFLGWELANDPAACVALARQFADLAYPPPSRA